MVTINGPVPPVIATLRFVLAPEQIVAVPLNVALLGGMFTVTVVLLPGAPEHVVASWILVMVYVFVDAGLTTTVWPEAIPVRLNVEDPSL